MKDMKGHEGHEEVTIAKRSVESLFIGPTYWGQALADQLLCPKGGIKNL
jgi:hypothetical protein